jgi:hypothetical protein
MADLLQFGLVVGENDGIIRMCLKHVDTHPLWIRREHAKHSI